MSAVPNPDPSKSNRGLIERFKDEYGAALSDARVSAEHTATPGWLKLYSDHHDTDRSRRRDSAKRVKVLAERLEDHGWSEDDEKEVKESAKASAEGRALNEAFQREVIDRVCAPVQACERIVMQYRNEAARVEADAPLHNIGLEELMRVEVGKQPKPRFIAETGEVEIVTPEV